MSYRTSAPVYNTDNSEKPPPSLDDERISPELFYKLAALDLECDAESDSEFEEEYEEYEDYPEYEESRDPYYEREGRSREREREQESYRQPAYPQASTHASEERYYPERRPSPPREQHRSPTFHHSSQEQSYSQREARYPSPPRERYRSSTFPRSQDHFSSQPPRAPTTPRSYPGSRYTSSPSSSSSSSQSPRAPTPPRSYPRPRYTSSPSNSAHASARAEELRAMEEERAGRQRTREELRERRKARGEEVWGQHDEEHLRARRFQEEERLDECLRERQHRRHERLREEERREARLREPYEYCQTRYEEERYESRRARPTPSRSSPRFGPDYERREMRIREPRVGERVRVEVPEGWKVIIVVED